MLRTLLICLMALGAAGVSAAGNNEGPHRPLDDAAAWQAVGRLDIEGSGFCTATLIAEHLILTAAHCVHSAQTGKIVDATSLVFKAGFHNGKAVATRTGRRLIVHSDYVHNSPERVRNVPFDIAVIELDKPIRHAAIQPFNLHDKPEMNQDVMVVSYARGRSAAASMEDDCKMFNSFVNALIYTCDVDFGSSGAPVFVMTQNGPQIASVITSKSKLDEKKVSLGAPLESALDLLLTQLATSDPQTKFIKVASADAKIKHDTSSVSGQLGAASAKVSKLPYVSRYVSAKP